MRLTALFPIALSFAQSAFSNGGTSSGGGELIQDRGNPWWLDNTKEVSYCINIDETNFHQSPARVVDLVQLAIAYWQREFLSAQYAWQAFPPVKLAYANQKFVAMPSCDDSTDLKFQFGVLDHKQAQVLSNPRRFISAAIRVEYDREQLHGKGFIYVAPDSGPLSPEVSNAPSQPWSQHNGNALFAVLVHELGHVFGLAHEGSRIIMNSTFPEQAYTNPGWIYDIDRFPGFFSIGVSNLVSCKQTGFSPRMQKFWGFPKNAKSFSIDLQDDTLKLSYATSEDLEECRKPTKTEHLGTITLDKKNYFETYTEVAGFFLPKEQKVYTGLLPDIYHRTILRSSPTRRGVYQLAGEDSTREVFVTFNFNNYGFPLKVSSEFEGEILIDALFDR